MAGSAPDVRAPRILLVEDNKADVRLTKEALESNKVLAHLEVRANGVEALEFLRAHANREDPERPDLVLLDLNLPGKSGREVLAEIRADEALQDMPVVVLTTSAAEADVIDAYDKRVNCYVTKPVDFNQFVRVVQSIGDFWFSVVRMPEDGTQPEAA